MLEQQAVELAYEALCKVLGQQQHRAAVLADLVRNSIAELRGRVGVSVHLHPADLRVLQADEQAKTRLAGVHCIADPSLDRASCVVETPRGRIDAGLLTQVERLRQLWSKETDEGPAAPEGGAPTA
jgi:flagellar assembly protein FliH